jgi:hypothetical protein
VVWLYVALGFVAGATIGRWWVLVAAIPFGIWFASSAPPDLEGLVGWTAGILMVMAITLGLFVRWIAKRTLANFR